MMLRLGSATEASTSSVQAQSCLTQAGMYFAYAEKEENIETKGALENLGYQSLMASNLYISRLKMRRTGQACITAATRKH
jgi:hypothetical protein